MANSKKIAEAFENLEVSLTLGGDIGQNLGALLKALGAEITALEEATTVPELFDQLIKMRESGTVQKLIQSADELTHVFEDAASEAKKTGALVNAQIDETLNEVRELGKTVDDLKKRSDEGDSWRAEE